MKEVIYKQCDECGHVFEIVTTEEELLADGYRPTDVDVEMQGYIFNNVHGDECEATLIVYRDELYD